MSFGITEAFFAWLLFGPKKTNPPAPEPPGPPPPEPPPAPPAPPIPTPDVPPHLPPPGVLPDPVPTPPQPKPGPQPAPWPQPQPPSLPPWPTGWTTIAQGDFATMGDGQEIVQRAYALLPTLWAEGENAHRTEKTSKGFDITYRAQYTGAPGGAQSEPRKGVTAWKPKAAAVPAGAMPMLR